MSLEQVFNVNVNDIATEKGNWVVTEGGVVCDILEEGAMSDKGKQVVTEGGVVWDKSEGGVACVARQYSVQNDLVCLEGEKNEVASGAGEGEIVVTEIEEGEGVDPVCNGLVSLEEVPLVHEGDTTFTVRSPEGSNMLIEREVDEDSGHCFNRFEVLSEGNEDAEGEMGKDFDSDPGSQVAVQGSKKVKGGPA